MKFKSKNIVIIIVLIIIFFISLTFHIPKSPYESFKDNECTQSKRNELQNEILSKLHQSIMDEQNKIVQPSSVILNIKEIIESSKYEDCNQIKEIQEIITKKKEDGASPETILSAINSYYTTKTK